MIFSRIALHGAALVLLLQASTTVSINSDRKIPPLCVVSGRVITAGEGSPLKSARVLLIPERREQTREWQVYSALSDSDGRFTIKDVSAGQYAFSARHTGYVDQRYQSHGDENGVMLSLKSGQQVNDVIFRMILASVITGRVSDEDGEPMAGIQVVALRRPNEDEMEENSWRSRREELRPVAGGQTDDRGQYRLYGLKPGEYYIRAVDEFMPPMMNLPTDEWVVRESLGSQYAPVYYPGVTQMSQSQAVPVGAGEEAQIDFTMRRTKTVEVSGRVIGADGKPTSDAYVNLDEYPPSEYSVGHGASPDEKGQFTIRGVPPGTYLVMAEERSSGSEGSGYHARQKIEVSTDNIDSVMLALGRGVKVSGRVTVAGGTVHFERLFITLMSREDESPGGWARVKKDGSFDVSDIPEGTFTFDLGGLEEGWYVKSARKGPDNILDDGLHIEKGEGGHTIQVVLSKSSAELDGSVSQDGHALIGARVHLTPDPETAYNRVRMRSSTTDQNGQFTFSGIAPGRYKVLAKSSDTQGAKPAVSDSHEVNLSEHDHKTVALTALPSQRP